MIVLLLPSIMAHTLRWDDNTSTEATHTQGCMERQTRTVQYTNAKPINIPSFFFFLTGDQAVDYHGVFRRRICSGSCKKISIFMQLKVFYESYKLTFIYSKQNHLLGATSKEICKRKLKTYPLSFA